MDGHCNMINALDPLGLPTVNTMYLSKRGGKERKESEWVEERGE